MIAPTPQPVTWAEVRQAIARLHEELGSALSRANEAVLSPGRDVLAGTEYREAYANLRWDVEGLSARAERLLETLAESAEPVRSLEAVLAEIRALGHEDMDLGCYGGYGGTGRWYMRTHTATEDHPSAPPGSDAWKVWRAAVEFGDAHADTPIAAAEARLEQILSIRVAQWFVGLWDREALLANLSGDALFNPVQAALIGAGGFAGAVPTVADLNAFEAAIGAGGEREARMEKQAGEGQG